MAVRSVVMDHELRYFETTPLAMEVALRNGVVAPVLSHYSGDFIDANVYKPLGDRTLESVRILLGSDALSGIRQGRAEMIEYEGVS